MVGEVSLPPECLRGYKGHAKTTVEPGDTGHRPQRPSFLERRTEVDFPDTLLDPEEGVRATGACSRSVHRLTCSAAYTDGGSRYLSKREVAAPYRPPLPSPPLRHTHTVVPVSDVRRRPAATSSKRAPRRRAAGVVDRRRRYVNVPGVRTTQGWTLTDDTTGNTPPVGHG